jgi:hypothetical protein
MFGKRTNTAFTQFKRDQENKNLQMEAAIKKISTQLEVILQTTQATRNAAATDAAIKDTQNTLLETAKRLEDDHHDRMDRIEELHQKTLEAIQILHDEEKQKKMVHEKEVHAWAESVKTSKETANLVAALEAKQQEEITAADQKSTLKIGMTDDTLAGTLSESGALDKTPTKTPYFVNIHM